MAKFYFKSSKKEENYVVPSRKTIDFLLSYSKALKVTNYSGLKFETILN